MSNPLCGFTTLGPALVMRAPKALRVTAPQDAPGGELRESSQGWQKMRLAGRRFVGYHRTVIMSLLFFFVVIGLWLYYFLTDTALMRNRTERALFTAWAQLAVAASDSGADGSSAVLSSALLAQSSR